MQSGGQGMKRDSSWRPDGWPDRYLEAYRKEHTGYGSPERAMFEAGADAELEVIYEWGNEDCLEHIHLSIKDNEARHTKTKKHSCPLCWQTLLDEVKGA